MIEDAIRATVKGILEHATVYRGWTLQGLGMLRLRFDNRFRLHVWSHEHRVPDVTVIHDHPWNFISHVISGEIENILYGVVDPADGVGEPYIEQEIVCGPKGCEIGGPVPVNLVERDRAMFLGGQDYAQNKYEVHESRPSDGAVSLIETWTAGASSDRAHVYYRVSDRWVSAEPRPATEEEVRGITRKALAVWP
jgi:hypothetical protein